MCTHVQYTYAYVLLVRVHTVENGEPCHNYVKIFFTNYGNKILTTIYFEDDQAKYLDQKKT